MKKEKRANNSLTICFKDKQNYQELIENGQQFIVYVVNYIASINFEIVHKPCCTCSHQITRFCYYNRKRNHNIIIWRLQCPECKKTWSVLPEFVLRYRGIEPEAAKKVLYNSLYGASLEVNYELFNVPSMKQYNYMCAIGRYGLVRILTNCSLPLPQQIISDEKHSKCRGIAVYLTTIVSGYVIWHLGYSQNLDEGSLTISYGEFKEEARLIDPKYLPQGVLTDGFSSTIKSMYNNFTKSQIGICLLHASLIMGRMLKKRLKDKAELLSKEFFNIFKNKKNNTDQNPIKKIGQKLRRFKEKIKSQASAISAEISQWVDRKKQGWYQTIRAVNMPKTTTLLDQAHNVLERKLFMMKHFHYQDARQSEYLLGIATLYNIIPKQKRAKNHGLSTIEMNSGRLPEKDWMLSLQILLSGGYKIKNNFTT